MTKVAVSQPPQDLYNQNGPNGCDSKQWNISIRALQKRRLGSFQILCHTMCLAAAGKSVIAREKKSANSQLI